MKLLKALTIVIGIIILLGLIGGLYIHYALPDVGDAPDIRVNGDSTSIERGKYLATHVAVCIDCHSLRDWSQFSGPVPAGREGSGGELFGREAGFPGTIYSTNLTPYQLSSWTDGEIYRAITSGIGKDGRALFPVMGYHRFGQMDKVDVYNIIAYLRTLPSIKNDVPKPELDFPVSLLNKLAPSPPEHQTRPPMNDTVRYGAYLVNAAGCVDCHSRQDKGRVISGTEFGGGMEFCQPGGIIRAPNITMHREAGIGAWTQELFVNRFKAYTDTAYHPKPLAKGELNSPMPWTMYAGMSREDLRAIYTYLKTVKTKASSVQIRSYE